MTTQTPTRPAQAGPVQKHLPPTLRQHLPHVRHPRATRGMSRTVAAVIALVTFVVGLGLGALLMQGDGAELDAANREVAALQQENADLTAQLNEALGTATASTLSVAPGAWTILGPVEAADEAADVFTATFPARNDGAVTDAAHFTVDMRWAEDLGVGTTSCAAAWTSPGESVDVTCAPMPLGPLARSGITEMTVTRTFGHL